MMLQVVRQPEEVLARAPTKGTGGSLFLGAACLPARWQTYQGPTHSMHVSEKTRPALQATTRFATAAYRYSDSP